MREIKILTQILMPVFIGVIIGGAIFDDSRATLWGVILLIADVTLGIIMQMLLDEEEKKSGWDKMSTTEKLKYIKSLNEDDGDDFKNDDDRGTILRGSFICKEFDRAFSELGYEKSGVKISCMDDIMNSSAATMLLLLCCEMEHAPTSDMLRGLYTVNSFNLEHNTIMYGFNIIENKVGEIVSILLVRVKNGIRFFTVELSYVKPVLCEYTGCSHKNYGPVEIRKISKTIDGIIRNG